MSFTNSPASNVIDRLRLMVGDTSLPPFEYLDDGTYTYLLTKHSDNEMAAAREAATYILFQLARSARERAGDIEVYGSEYFKNYKDALEKFLNGGNGVYDAAMPYFGGISVEDFRNNLYDTDALKPFDVVTVDLTDKPFDAIC